MSGLKTFGMFQDVKVNIPRDKQRGFAKEPCERDFILQKRPIHLRGLERRL